LHFEEKLNQPYSIPDRIIRQQIERRILARIAKETKEAERALKIGVGPERQKALVEVLRSLRLEYQQFLRNKKG
jgi:hypothetical protein